MTFIVRGSIAILSRFRGFDPLRSTIEACMSADLHLLKLPFRASLLLRYAPFTLTIILLIAGQSMLNEPIRSLLIKSSISFRTSRLCRLNLRKILFHSRKFLKNGMRLRIHAIEAQVRE